MNNFQSPFPGIPMDVLFSIGVFAVIVIGGALISVAKARQRRRDVGLQQTGVQVAGLITHKRVPNSFDRERGQHSTRIRLAYVDPASGLGVVHEQLLFSGTRNIPNQLTGFTDFGAIAAGYRDQKAWMAEMTAAGATKEEIRATAVAKAIEQSNESEVDGSGFRRLRNPIPVTVFIPVDGSLAVAVVFEVPS
jgi:hypothetical protein